MPIAKSAPDSPWSPRTQAAPGSVGAFAYAALMTALAATVGVGNAVATVAVGGPGALFWMWMTALVGWPREQCCCGAIPRITTTQQ